MAAEGPLRRLLRGTADTRIRAIWRGLTPLVVALVGMIAGVLAIRTVARPFLRDLAVALGADGPVTLLSGGTLALVVTGLTLAVATRLDQRPLREYGLRASRRDARDVLGGLLVGSLMAGVPLAAFLAFGGAHVADTLTGPDAGIPLVIAGIALALYGLAANVVYEEVLFRRLVLTNFAEGLSARSLSPTRAVLAALVAHSLLFGAFHLVFQGGGGVDGRSLGLLISSALYGSVWASAYVFTGRLSLPIGIHLGYNLFHAMIVQPSEVNMTLPAVVELAITVDSTTGAEYASYLLVFAVGLGSLLAWLFLTRGEISIDEGLVTLSRGKTDGDETENEEEQRQPTLAGD